MRQFNGEDVTGKYINLASGASAMPRNHLPCDWRQTHLSGHSFNDDAFFVPVTGRWNVWANPMEQSDDADPIHRYTTASVGAYGIQDQCPFFSPWRFCELTSLDTQVPDDVILTSAYTEALDGYKLLYQTESAQSCVLTCLSCKKVFLFSALSV